MDSKPIDIMDGVIFTNLPTEDYDMVSLWLYIVEGAIITLANLYLFLRIMTSSELRSQKEFVIIGAMVLFDFFFGTTYFTSGVWRACIIYRYELIPAFTRWQCFLTPVSQFFTIITTGAGYLMIITTLDRVFCVFWPIKYMKVSVKYAYCIVVAPYILELPTHVMSFIRTYPDDVNKTSPSTCLFNVGVDIKMYEIMRSIRIVCCLISALIYIPVFIKMYQTIRHHEVLSGMSSSAHRMLFNMTRTIVLITGNTLILFTVPDIITYFSPLVPTSIFYLMNLNKGIVNLIIFLITQKQLRSLLHKRHPSIGFSSSNKHDDKMLTSSKRRVGLTRVA